MTSELKGVRRCALVAVVALAAALGCTAASGCASGPQQAEARPSGLDTAAESAKLYQAILDVFETRSWPVELASEENLLVTSAFEEVNAELRRRYIARVIPFQRGVALNVTAEYQRRDRTGEAPVWVPAEDPYTQRRAKSEEQELGGAIQSRYGELSR